MTKLVSWVTLACIWCMTGLVAFWVFEPSPRYSEVMSSTILDVNRKETATFRPGDVVYIERVLRTNRHVTYNQAWRLLVSLDTNTIVAREEIFPLPFPLGETVRTVTFHIPLDAKPGTYMIQTFVNYKLNPLRDVLFEFDRYFITVKP